VETSLSVSVKELPVVHVAYITYKGSPESSDMHDQISECFHQVQAWVRQLGYDPFTQLTIGVPRLTGNRLASYDCCVQVGEDVQLGSDGVEIMDLPGGRYAVVTIEKTPQIIGDSISSFYGEYAPRNAIEIDSTRPTYEVYYKDTMEYCAPIL
jgi:DNA gyrase inhibitor GyrI